MFNHYFDIELENKSFEVCIDVFYDITNDGIGDYEYWGHKCHDHGEDYAETTYYKIISVSEIEDGKIIKELDIKTLIPEIKDEIETYWENNQKELDNLANEDFGKRF